MDRPRAARAVLAAGALAYALAVAAASQAPGPRAWGLHLPGFLPPEGRLLLLAFLFGGAALLTIDYVQTKQAPKEAKRKANKKKSAFPRWAGWLLLIPWAMLLWRLVARTRFLGDGTVWLDGIKSGNPSPFSEPLAAAVWGAYARLLRGMGIPIDPVTAGVLPVVCGMAAAAILWGIASELTRRSGSRVIAFAVLATLGIVQLYFGYIESYPVVSVAILAYLWLGLRSARDADHPIWLALALAVTIPFHLATVFLAPSYLYLLLRDKRPVLQRVGLAVLPLAGAAGLLVLLGYAPARWLGAFRIAARAVEPGHGPGFYARAYPPVSLDHGWDLLNAILLVLPVPLMLLLAAVAGRSPDATRDRDPATIFLAVAAIPGLLLASALVLPVAPAQDWDLTGILLLPLAVLGVNAGCSIQKVPLSGMRGAGLVLTGVGALFSFVLVNAGEESGLRRYETLVGPGAKITQYARAYGNEVLAAYDVSRRDFPRALIHSQRALDAEPTNPRYWIKKGAALYEMGRFEEAMPVLEEGIRRGPARDDAYYDLGNCYAKVKRYPEAVACFRDAIRLGGPRPDYYNNFAVALFYVGKQDSARALWTEVVRRWPAYTLSARALERHFGPGAVDSARSASSHPRSADAPP